MRRITCLTAVAVFLTTRANAQQWIVDRWPARLAESSAFLKKGQYERSLKVAEGVIGEMMELLGGGPAETQAFGVALTHKALALAGLGRHDDARWYWHGVLTLFPRFAESDLSMFGEAGAFLKQNVASPGLAQASVRPDRVKPPRIVKKVDPRFPRGAYQLGYDGVFIIEITVTKSGVPSQPRILKSLPAPTFAYAALEAVRRWRFAPAELDGEPIDAVFTLTINYKAE